MSYSWQEQRGYKRTLQWKPESHQNIPLKMLRFWALVGPQLVSLSKLQNSTVALLGVLLRLLDSWSGLIAGVVVVGRWTLQVRTTRGWRIIDLCDDEWRRKRNQWTELELNGEGARVRVCRAVWSWVGAWLLILFSRRLFSSSFFLEDWESEILLSPERKLRKAEIVQRIE